MIYNSVVRLVKINMHEKKRTSKIGWAGWKKQTSKVHTTSHNSKVRFDPIQDFHVKSSV